MDRVQLSECCDLGSIPNGDTMSESPTVDDISYQHGRGDMKERVIEKLEEELKYLRDINNSEQLVSLVQHLIDKINRLS
jgi:hypothetical protein